MCPYLPRHKQGSSKIMNQMGYACINMFLREKGIFNSRTMRKKTFLEKGLPYASQLVLQNVKDMMPIFESIIRHVPPPVGDSNKPLQLQITTLDYSDFLGRIVIGKIHNLSLIHI